MSNEIKIGPVSNRADYSESWQAFDEDGAAIDLTGATIVLEIVDPKRSSSSLISATTDNGKITISTTTFTVAIARSELAELDPQNYRVGCTIKQDDFTEQFFVGDFPVYDGVVSA
jgi:hypothetical protein